MPEVQVTKGIETMLTLGKGMDRYLDCERELYRLEIVPITHSSSKKKKTLVVSNRYEWTSPRISNPQWCSYAPDHWIERADRDGIGDYMAIVPYAPLICRSRGKLLCIAAGPHALVICLALQSNVVGMPIDTYHAITSNDIAGPNPNRLRASEELRVFKIQQEYIVPHSSREERTVKVVAAFVSERWAWVINDFNTTIIMHLFSRNRPWTPAELSPGTKVWNNLFDSIERGGPDWVLETPLALRNLDTWRAAIIKDYKNRHFQTILPFGGLPQTRDPLQANPTLSYNTLFRPIIIELLGNRFNSFAGIGNYSANDLLHKLSIHPFTPSHVICTNDRIFEKFENGVYDYLAEFSSPAYLHRASSVANTMNPFSFNDHLNTEFMSKWIHVYQRSKALVGIPHFNDLLKEGLLDEEHTIGCPYISDESNFLDPSKRKRVFLPVFKCEGGEGIVAYTVINAKPPPEWAVEYIQTPMVKDLKRFSYQTTIGPSQFRVQVWNRPKYDGIEPGTLAIGRPSIMRTGKVGRPRKGFSKKRLEKYKESHTGRRSL